MASQRTTHSAMRRLNLKFTIPSLLQFFHRLPPIEGCMCVCACWYHHSLLYLSASEPFPLLCMCVLLPQPAKPRLIRSLYFLQVESMHHCTLLLHSVGWTKPTQTHTQTQKSAFLNCCRTYFSHLKHGVSQATKDDVLFCKHFFFLFLLLFTGMLFFFVLALLHCTLCYLAFLIHFWFAFYFTICSFFFPLIIYRPQPVVECDILAGRSAPHQSQGRLEARPGGAPPAAAHEWHEIVKVAARCPALTTRWRNSNSETNKANRILLHSKHTPERNSTLATLGGRRQLN